MPVMGLLYLYRDYREYFAGVKGPGLRGKNGWSPFLNFYCYVRTLYARVLVS